MKPAFFLLLVVLLSACTVVKTPLIFVGTYTEKLGHVDGKAVGIYACRFNPRSGALVIVDSTPGLANPSFLTLAPDGKHLYAVGENGGKPGQPYGSVAAYNVGPFGKLSKINEMPSYGVAPCHVSTDRTGRFVFVANYATGNIASYGIRPDGGLTDSICFRQDKGAHPWAHMVYPAPDKRFLWSCDKGSDRVFVYTIEPDGKLTRTTEIQAAQNAGPRHLDFHPTDPNLIAWINENDNTVVTGRFNPATTRFTQIDNQSTLPTGFKGNNTCADIHFHPNGRFLYGSNRGHNSIAVFAVDAVTGKIKAIGNTPVGGEIPRNFLITADGKWLLAANQNSSTVTSFRINDQTGLLTPAGTSRVPTPVCLKALPFNK
jgi:6-phosphogluconolactonase